jgi:SRSO17 transposase
MDAKAIRGLKPRLNKFLKEFSDCFARKDTRMHLTTYVNGQLSELQRKSVEPIALAARVPPRTLQNFLTVLSWDHQAVRDRVAEVVGRDHAHPHAVGVIDETSDDKNGVKTPGVNRQWCGSKGKVENCIVTVHLAYATSDFHCLLDGDLYLPKDWSQDRERCRNAGIPDDVVYRPKWQIALELYDRAIAKGVQFKWLTFDEGYGSKPGFLRGLIARQQGFVGEVPSTFTGWIEPPGTTDRPYRKFGSGRPRRTPRLKAGSAPTRSVAHHLHYNRVLHQQRWVRYHVKDGEKGPIIWEAKQVMFVPVNEDGLPGVPLHLAICRNPLDGEIKYFLANAPPETPLEAILPIAFSRWKVERCFEDGKQEVGLDHYEGRTWQGLIRHLILTSVSYLFLAKVHQEQRGEKPGTNRVPGPHGDLSPVDVLVA